LSRCSNVFKHSKTPAEGKQTLVREYPFFSFSSPLFSCDLAGSSYLISVLLTDSTSISNALPRRRADLRLASNRLSSFSLSLSLASSHSARPDDSRTLDNNADLLIRVSTPPTLTPTPHLITPEPDSADRTHERVDTRSRAYTLEAQRRSSSRAFWRFKVEDFIIVHHPMCICKFD
jgi:hypothetical protein